MTESFFQMQLRRLTTNWPNTYNSERSALLWREVKDFSDEWFARLVDRFIGELRQPPLMPEFREAISAERERNWSREKAQHARDAKEFFLIANDPDFRGSVIKTIIERMQGKVPEKTWNEFIHGLNKLTGNRL